MGILLETSKELKQQSLLHIDILTKSIPEGRAASHIEIEGFPHQKWMKYFPNYR